MQIIFHLGAHRSATTTFQHYMRSHAAGLSTLGIGFWGPQRLRGGGLFDGLYAGPNGSVSDDAIAAAKPRIARALAVAHARGMRYLVISDENALGSVKGNLRHASLYPDALSRLQGFARALDRPVDKVLLGMRPLDSYWSSAIAYGVKRGAALPDDVRLDAIANSKRSWRDVVCDVVEAFDGADIELHSFAEFADYPDTRLALALASSATLPTAKRGVRLNAAPDLEGLRACLSDRGATTNALPSGKGRWLPFTAAQSAVLAERHADDVFWCVSGAGGIAKWIDVKEPREAGISLTVAARRGHIYDQARHMGQTG
ncbi:hypothetical protein [Lentibacter sp. XHP0401]|uniref:hypothetical protein n=1 Tax=Lentibacter sp. XHP0401 TaxID=2984334 RepID=UPI0021E8E496|nr:hypothetical protein [Lentibacter sp. XHP0401]MCV2891590.1 hypothetical protein [Lentibacter sp. XHP0401]